MVWLSHGVGVAWLDLDASFEETDRTMLLNFSVKSNPSVLLQLWTQLTLTNVENISSSAGVES
jgi:hypothetical protein